MFFKEFVYLMYVAEFIGIESHKISLFFVFLVSVGSVTISSLLFLILVICEFSSFLSLSSAKDLKRFIEE